MFKNEVAKAEIIAAAEKHGSFDGRNRKNGKVWRKINFGQMIVGYDPKANKTYFHGFEGLNMHEEFGDVLGLAA